MRPCERCGSDTRMMVQVTLSAPSELYHHLSKSNLRRKDVYLVSANWETTDFICTNNKCNTVTNGYGNYVTNLKKQNEELIACIERMRVAGGSQEFQAAFDSAKDTLMRICAKG